IGIPPLKLRHIFEPGEKKSTTGTENEKGTGLGLLVTKEFVQLNKGSIIIESEEGSGTTARLSFPSA
ncbi:MAG TPA: ATP-binding protein, partial [Chitinophagaceae bacterium]|nr:ATP-binding protein [Chitinophagaceae bacterium]